MLTTTEAAEIAGVKRVTINQWIRRKHLKAIKFGRDRMIDEKDLAALLAHPPKNGRPPVRQLLASQVKEQTK